MTHVILARDLRSASAGRSTFDAGWRARRLVPLRVFADLPEIKEHTVLVADDLCVVPGRDRGHLAGRELLLAAVVHVDAHPPLDAVPEVRHLARVRARDRLDVGRPTPARLEGASL